MSDGIGITAVGRPDQLLYFAVLFHQRRVQSERWRRILSQFVFLHFIVEGFGFCLSDTLIEMTGRCMYQVFTVSLVHPFGKNLRIKHHREEFIAHFIESLPCPERQSTSIHLLKLFTKIVRRKAGHHLLAAIVMIDAVGEPDTFQIHLHGTKLFCVVVYVPVRKNNLHHLTNPEVVLSKLIECDIPAV